MFLTHTIIILTVNICSISNILILWSTRNDTAVVKLETIYPPIHLLAFPLVVLCGKLETRELQMRLSHHTMHHLLWNWTVLKPKRARTNKEFHN